MRDFSQVNPSEKNWSQLVEKKRRWLISGSKDQSQIMASKIKLNGEPPTKTSVLDAILFGKALVALDFVTVIIAQTMKIVAHSRVVDMIVVMIYDDLYFGLYLGKFITGNVMVVAELANSTVIIARTMKIVAHSRVVGNNYGWD